VCVCVCIACRLRLGVVYGWDPDRDLVLPEHFLEQSELTRLIVAIEEEGEGREVSESEGAVLGGWFQSGDVCQGTLVEMRLIG
jgi:hypothetical protein